MTRPIDPDRRAFLARHLADELDRFHARADHVGERRALAKLALLYGLTPCLRPELEREALALDWPPRGFPTAGMVLADQAGATAVEYALIVALVAICILPTVSLLGALLNVSLTIPALY
jgi:Flp pilus assembly pilin Flp